MTDETKEQRWVSLEIKNYMGIKTLFLRRNGSTTTIGGKNGQGKSSTLRFIRSMVGGASEMPDEPLREGERTGGGTFELDDYVIKLALSKTKKPKLSVKTKEGSSVPRPASFLKQLTGGKSYDPGSFYSEKPEKQLEILKSIAGEDTSEIDDERAALFSRRTEINRRCNELQAQTDNAPYHEDAPENEAVVSELLSELTRRQKQNMALGEKKERLDRLREKAKHVLERIDGLNQELAIIKEQGKELAAEVEAGKILSVDDVTKQIDEMDETNRKVRENRQRDELLVKFEASVQESESLTEKINELDEKKRQLAESCKFPVPGLGFGDGCVLYNGRPLDQACGMERMRVAIAIGAALNPGLKLLTVDNEEKLDEDEHKNLCKLADEGGYDLIVARVSTGDECDIIIEDGEVAS